MKHLYAPWRGTYAQNAQQQSHLASGCPFCAALQSTDDEVFYIIKRLPCTVILLNIYPYNPGHILIIPQEHKANLSDLSQKARTELIETISNASTILSSALGNTGINIGINLGDEASGGSIPEHLHVHMVPRWKGDTNFMPVLTDTKQLSEDLNEVYRELKKVF